MIYDIHAHIIGLESGHDGNYICPPRRMNVTLRLVLGRVLRKLPRDGRASPDERLRRFIYNWVGECRADRIVMLAMDGVYNRDGTPDLDNTQMIVSNNFTAKFAAGHPKLLWGASIHPYRKDAIAELDRVVEMGACLVKWLPSAQNIPPDDPRLGDFYDRLVHHRMPLLSHTGPEHTLAKFSDDLNLPRRLEAAVRRGVTVIAAHCGARMFLYERSRFSEWAEMARKFPNMYGDVSAFCLPLHGGPLRRILRDPKLLEKIVYGSDAPIPAWSFWYAPTIGLRKAFELNTITNPLEKCREMMKAMGLPGEVFSRGEKLLRLPAGGAK